MYRAATMSSDGQYRWLLSRRWGLGPYMTWIMLNPSTANHQQDDPTIRRCIGFAREWGFAGLVVVNLFAVRMTDPVALLQHPDPIGPENAAFLRKGRRLGELTVAAWGAHQAARVLFKQRGYPHADEAVEALKHMELRCLGTTMEGHPRHPLYVRRETELQPWPQPVRKAR